MNMKLSITKKPSLQHSTYVLHDISQQKVAAYNGVVLKLFVNGVKNVFSNDPIINLCCCWQKHSLLANICRVLILIFQTRDVATSYLVSAGLI